MNAGMIGRAIAVAALGVALGVTVEWAIPDDQGGSARVAPQPSPGMHPEAPPQLSTDDGAATANRTAGWAVIAPGTPASIYWGRHGVGADDRYGYCEAATRVQYVRGYARVGADDSRQPLWTIACAGLPAATRHSITIAAVEWSATHEEGDG